MHWPECFRLSEFSWIWNKNLAKTVPHTFIESESGSVVSDSLWAQGLYSPWNSLGQNTGVGSLSLLQQIFLTQESDSGLPLCKWIPYQLSHKGSPRVLEWVAYPFSSRSSWPRHQTGVTCIAGGFFTNWAIRKSHLLSGKTFINGIQILLPRWTWQPSVL